MCQTPGVNGPSAKASPAVRRRLELDLDRPPAAGERRSSRTGSGPRHRHGNRPRWPTARTRSRADATDRRGAVERRTLRSRVYLPACSIAAVAAALIVVIGCADHWGGDNFAASMTSLRVVVAGPLTLAIIGVLLVVERLRPAQRRPLFARGYRQDLLFTVFNATLVVPLVTALTLSFQCVVQRCLPWLVLPKTGTVPRWGAIAAIFVAMDGLQLVRPSGEPPVARALALPRAAPLPRGHERPDGLPHAPAHSCVLPLRAGPGHRARWPMARCRSRSWSSMAASSPSPTPTPTWASARSDGSS